MEKTSILFLIESLSGGGAEKVLATLVKHLDQFDVSLCCVVDCGKYVEEIKPYVHYSYILPNVENAPLWRRFLYRVKYKCVYEWLPLPMVYRLFVPKHADVEVAFVEGFATKLMAHSCNHKAKKIAWVHIDLEHFHWTKNVYKDLDEETEAYKQYSEIVTVSNTAESAFKRVFKIDTPRTQTLYNPIDTGKIIRQSEKEAALMPKHCIRFVSIGRLTRQKAYDRLLRIALKLKTEGYSFELWILGDGEQRDSLDVFVRENGLDDVVKMLGFKPNPYVYLKQCDLFVCSSLSEGYSTAVTEALILGLPVVTTDCSGMSELLKNGECGVITENSEDSLFRGIKRLLDEPATLKHYQLKAIERGKDFSLEALMKPIEKILAE